MSLDICFYLAIVGELAATRTKLRRFDNPYEVALYIHLKPYKLTVLGSNLITVYDIAFFPHDLSPLPPSLQRSAVNMRAYKVAVMMILVLPATPSLAAPIQIPAMVRRKDFCTNAPTTIAGR